MGQNCASNNDKDPNKVKCHIQSPVCVGGEGGQQIKKKLDFEIAN